MNNCLVLVLFSWDIFLLQILDEMYHHFITMIFQKYMAEFILGDPLMFVQMHLSKEFSHRNLNPPITHCSKTCCSPEKVHHEEVKEKKKCCKEEKKKKMYFKSLFKSLLVPSHSFGPQIHKIHMKMKTKTNNET